MVVPFLSLARVTLLLGPLSVQAQSTPQSVPGLLDATGKNCIEPLTSSSQCGVHGPCAHWNQIPSTACCLAIKMGLLILLAHLCILLFNSATSSMNMPSHHARPEKFSWRLPKTVVCVLLYMSMPHLSKGLTLCEHTPSACDGSHSSSTSV